MAAFRLRYAACGERLIGVAARFAAEKGIEYLLEALPRIRAEVGSVKILFTGDAQRVVGEEKYRARTETLFARAGDSCVFVGMLASSLPPFYAAWT